jgi:hypothetical protein
MWSNVVVFVSNAGFLWFWSLFLARNLPWWRSPSKLRTVLIFLHQQLWIVGLGVSIPFVKDYPGDGFWARLWDLIVVAGVTGLWWGSRNWPDENVWKRRGRRLKNKVSALGGKLVVVPETT